MKQPAMIDFSGVTFFARITYATIQFPKQIPHQIRGSCFSNNLILRSHTSDNYAELATMSPSSVSCMTNVASRSTLSRFSLSQFVRSAPTSPLTLRPWPSPSADAVAATAKANA
ncbi:hypothetical protein [Bradyrhizobium sp. USDA 4473]